MTCTAAPLRSPVPSKRRGPRLLFSGLTAVLAIAVPAASGQVKPAEPPAKASSDASRPGSSDVVKMSPFVINAEEESGWVATESLAGSRLNTPLKDIAAPIEVLTKDFMDDFALNSIGEATIYTTNVEGFGDNLELGTGQGFSTGFPPPTRIRGLGNGTLSRDFFAVQMASDNYNLERVTIASGPNNLLFGTGNPAGVIDTTLKRPAFRNFVRLDTQFDTNDSQRYAVDVNRELIKGKLAARFNWLREEKEYAYKPSGTDQRRWDVALQYRPFKSTSITVNYEDAMVHNIAPQLALPFDDVTLWYAAGKPVFVNPSITGAFNAGSVTPGLFQREPAYPMVMLGYVQGYQPGQIVPVRNTVSVVNANQGTGVSPLDRGGDWSLLDGSLIPVDVNVSGLTKLQRVHSKIGNVFINQQVGEHLFLEFAAQKEEYESWNAGLFANTSPATIQVDANKNLVDGVTPNPNFGKLFIEGINNGPFRSQDLFKTEDWRFSAAYEWDFAKKRHDTWWGRFLGRQRLAGLLSGNKTDMREQEFFARILPAGGIGGAEPVINGITLRQPYAPNGNPQNGWAQDTSRNIQYRFYLSDSDFVPSPDFDMFAPSTFVDSNGKPFTIDMTNTGLKDQYGRRLGPFRENIMLKTFLRTQQLAYQGFFWDDRLVITYGWRSDKTNRADVDHGYAADTFTGLRPMFQDITFLPYDPANEETGETTTRGFIVRPLRGFVKLPLGADITLGYNKSRTFQANVSNLDPYGVAYPGAEGSGEDKSIRLDLFDGRFGLRYTKFENEGGPQRAGNTPYNLFRQTLAAVLNRVTMLNSGQMNLSMDPNNPNLFPALGVGDPYWVTSYNHSTGEELGLDWSVTRNFQVRFNYNTQHVTESNIGMDWWAYLDKYLPAYKALTYKEGGNTDPRDMNGDGVISTWTWDTAWRSDSDTTPIAAWFQSTVIQGPAGQQIIQALDGKENEFGRNERFNVIWSYRFSEGRLRGLSVGGAYRYRGAPLLAYAKTTINGQNTYDLSHPYHGETENVWDLSLNYRGRTNFWRFKGYRVGVNVRNLFNADSLYARVVDINGIATRVAKVSEPRVLILSLGSDF